MKTSKKFLLNYLYIFFIVLFSGEIQAENVLPVYDSLGGEFEMHLEFSPQAVINRKHIFRLNLS